MFEEFNPSRCNRLNDVLARRRTVISVKYSYTEFQLGSTKIPRDHYFSRCIAYIYSSELRFSMGFQSNNNAINMI